MRFGGFWKTSTTSAAADQAALARIKRLTAELLALGEEVTVSANEIVCADPACPGVETVILVMRPGERTRAYKVQAAAAEVSEAALKAALLSPAS